MSEINPSWVAHLSGAFERARPVLFTGAGFSTAAKSVSAKPVASYSELKKSLWEICFPSTSYEPGATLQDLYEAALQTAPHRLGELLRNDLSVDVASMRCRRAGLTQDAGLELRQHMAAHHDTIADRVAIQAPK